MTIHLYLGLFYCEIYFFIFTFQAPFPKKFPFSQFVPEVYDQVKEFINACLKFSQDLNLRYIVDKTNY